MCVTRWRGGVLSVVRWSGWRSPWLAAGLAHEALVLLAWEIWPTAASLRYLAVNMWDFPAAHFLLQYDALYFFAIAHHGYLVPGLPRGAATVFFPAVALLLWAWRSLTVFLVVQQVAFLVCCWLLSRVAARWQPFAGVSSWAVWFFAVNPAFIYYSAPYAELWTMLGALAAVEWWTQQRPVASFLAFVGTALTQASGLLAGALPLYSAIQNARAGRWRRVLSAVGLGAGPLVGVGLYAGYLAVRFGHPLWFSTEEGSAMWRAGFSWPLLGLGRALALAWAGVEGYPELVAMTLLLMAGVVGAVVYARRSPDPLAWGMALYAGLGLLLDVSFGTRGHPLHSTVRLLSDYFPVYLGLAALAATARMRWTLLVISMVLGVYGAHLYLHGFFFQ